VGAQRHTTLASNPGGSWEAAKAYYSLHASAASGNSLSSARASHRSEGNAFDRCGGDVELEWL
jgi:hypothetical protein